MNAIARSALTAAVVVLLGSCLNVETHIDLEEDHSGQVSVSYDIETELWELGVFDSDSSIRAIPVSEADFRRTARRIEGVELLEYALSAGESITEVEATLSFANLEALNGIYSPRRSLITIEEQDGERVYSQQLGSGEEPPVRDREFIEAYFSDYTVGFTLTAPSEIRSSSTGELLNDGMTARLSLGILQVLTANEPLIWEIRY
ncbi:MAG: hypothetical protein GVY23_06240 [Spirochaetes bacterium]|nr:hypothetical protein [Spirochaetota bacterium]